MESDTTVICLSIYLTGSLGVQAGPGAHKYLGSWVVLEIRSFGGPGIVWGWSGDPG